MAQAAEAHRRDEAVSASSSSTPYAQEELVRDLKLWACSPRVPLKVQLLILEAIGRLSQPSESAPPTDSVAVPRRFLLDFIAAVNWHQGHGTPSIDRAWALTLFGEADQLLKNAAPSAGTTPPWEDCVRCGAAILNEHPEATDVSAASESAPPSNLAKVLADARGSETYREESAALAVNGEMVDRFLSWPLPKDFSPDCGISFSPPKTPHPIGYWPIGTNLLTATQAEAMLRHVVAPLLSELQQERDIRAERENFIQMIAEAFNVENEPHQTFFERLYEVACARSTANSATACSKCGGMGQTMDGHPCSSCGGAGR